MKTILLVEDDGDLRAVLGHFLAKTLRCRVLEADGAWPALRLYDENRPSVIVSDLQMPLGSGIDLVHALRERKSSIPVVIFSSCLPEVRESLRRADVVVIEKPDFQKLVKTLRCALAGIRGVVS